MGSGTFLTYSSAGQISNTAAEGNFSFFIGEQKQEFNPCSVNYHRRG